MNFLIVDDSALSRRMIRNCVTQLGHTAVEAADGAAALERYVIDRPDFVFLDLVMPGMTGFEVLAHLRSIDPSARVIISTADVQSSTRDQLKEGGALAVINKPVTIEQISSTLNTLLSGEILDVPDVSMPR
jgi:two-component system chemotaxis response regulator CheY